MIGKNIIMNVLFLLAQEKNQKKGPVCFLFLAYRRLMGHPDAGNKIETEQKKAGMILNY